MNRQPAPTESLAGSGELSAVVDLDRHPLDDDTFRSECKRALDDHGVLVLPDLLVPDAIRAIRDEGERQRPLAHYTTGTHTVYLAPDDPAFPDDHPSNRKVISSKGCITTDQIPDDSALRTLYDSGDFRDFLCSVLGERALHEYADPLSSINLHYAAEGQELGWHYDNSSFAITLLIERPEGGAAFEYVRDVRDADAGDMGYERTNRVLDGEESVRRLAMDAGSLVLFRGRNSLHRVTPTEGKVTRMLVVLAYNAEPDISLSESARMTFYGRLG